MANPELGGPSLHQAVRLMGFTPRLFNPQLWSGLPDPLWTGTLSSRTLWSNVSCQIYQIQIQIHKQAFWERSHWSHANWGLSSVRKLRRIIPKMCQNLLRSTLMIWCVKGGPVDYMSKSNPPPRFVSIWKPPVDWMFGSNSTVFCWEKVLQLISTKTPNWWPADISRCSRSGWCLLMSKWATDCYFPF